MVSRWSSTRAAGAAWPLGAAVVSVLAFWCLGWTFFDAWVLDLGSMAAPAPRHTTFLFYWTLLGSTASAFLALGLTRVSAGRRRVDPSRPRAHVPDAWWLAGGVAIAFAIPWTIRTFLLRGAALTDDESAYRFMAELVASGRLWTTSHPMKAFFDRVFMINDGKFYAQYFIGWPALMAPGVWIGVAGYMNAFYSALTVPALWAVARRMGGPVAARVTLLLYLASPMLAVGAATGMAHPSCTMAITWAAWCFFLARERPSAWWPHAGVAFFFSLGFLVRPTSALGVGLPVLIAWLVDLGRMPARRRWHALLSFAVPAAIMATAFVGVNVAQNGSPLVSSYARMQQYMREVNYQNVGWSAEHPPTGLSSFMMPNRQVGKALATTTVALVRLVFDLFGSPLTVAIVAFAWVARGARLAWWSAFSFVALHFFMGEPGVDTFGPVHYYELSLPLLLLAGVGAAEFARLSSVSGSPSTRPNAAIVVVSLIVVSLAAFVPVRLGTLKRVAYSANMPADAVRRARVSNAVIFTAGLFTPQECIAPTRHFGYFRPNNDPGLTNDILWVNHLGWQVDHELMRYFPGRTGYLLQWDGCREKLIRLSSAKDPA